MAAFLSLRGRDGLNFKSSGKVNEERNMSGSPFFQPLKSRILKDRRNLCLFTLSSLFQDRKIAHFERRRILFQYMIKGMLRIPELFTIIWQEPSYIGRFKWILEDANALLLQMHLCIRLFPKNMRIEIERMVVSSSPNKCGFPYSFFFFGGVSLTKYPSWVSLTKFEVMKLRQPDVRRPAGRERWHFFVIAVGCGVEKGTGQGTKRKTEALWPQSFFFFYEVSMK